VCRLVQFHLNFIPILHSINCLLRRSHETGDGIVQCRVMAALMSARASSDPEIGKNPAMCLATTGNPNGRGVPYEHERGETRKICHLIRPIPSYTVKRIERLHATPHPKCGTLDRPSHYIGTTHHLRTQSTLHPERKACHLSAEQHCHTYAVHHKPAHNTHASYIARNQHHVHRRQLRCKGPGPHRTQHHTLHTR
jgi:hypothetical protein